ncbi:MAG: hypothetical protein JWO52_1474 [Gammaproteobacteria bacterium]|nr:hypothetical protein [Gammaproteobacteria bacterium]
MKASNVIALALGAGMCIGLYACGGHDSGMMPMPPSQPAPPSQPQPMMLSVNGVLGRATVKSETDDPLAVNGGAVTVNPANDEESDPVAVD